MTIRQYSSLARVVGAEKAEVSCYHHQRVDRPGTGLEVTARAVDGTIEALALPAARGWFASVQWHLEDAAHEDPAQRDSSTRW